MAEYLFLYLAVYGSIPGFGNVDYALYVSDSIENGVKKMRLRLELRCQNSEFLKKYIKVAKFTDIRWYFENAQGKKMVVTGHGAKTGVRGTVELSTRPQLAVLDDLLSDDDARSPTVIESIENTVYSAIDYALHPSRRKVIWSGTPFNAKDPLYKAIESGVWHVNVYPVCETFPCTREAFKGAWGDRFGYDYVNNQYHKSKGAGKLDSFNQELMLRIMSAEDRLVEDSDLIWYKRSNILRNKGQYNFYITTDFATSDKEHADFSVLNVWAHNNNGDWLWVDGVCKQMLMDASIDHLFRLVQEYSPQEVGIETTGQQGGFISWIQNEMGNRNIYFTLSKGKGSNAVGIRPTKDKMSRFQQNAIPLFKAKKIWFPEELKDSTELAELLLELSLATFKGFKSKHDDCGTFDMYVDTSTGQVPLGELTAQDKVVTYKHDQHLSNAPTYIRLTGVKEVYAITLESGDTIEFSRYHPILTNKGYVCVCDLTTSTKIVRANICRSSMMELSGPANQEGTTKLPSVSKTLLEKIGYIPTFLKNTLGKFQQVCASTIGIMIKRTINRQISYYSQRLNTLTNIPNYTLPTGIGLQSMLQTTSITYKDLLSWAKQVSMWEKTNEAGKNQIKSYVPVPNVVNSSSYITTLRTQLDFVILYVLVYGIGRIVSLKKNVPSVLLSLSNRHAIKDYVVQSVLKELRYTPRQEQLPKGVSNVDYRSEQAYVSLRAEQNARELEKIDLTKNMYKLEKISKIESIGWLPTYNFEVEDTHNYSVQQGYVVHNCIDTISMLAELNAWKPSEVSVQDAEEEAAENSMWNDDHNINHKADSSYFV